MAANSLYAIGFGVGIPRSGESLMVAQSLTDIRKAQRTVSLLQQPPENTVPELCPLVRADGCPRNHVICMGNKAIFRLHLIDLLRCCFQIHSLVFRGCQHEIAGNV